ncbi:MAG: hypothetical protein KDN22_00775 [Verrucomicrobiae bacterium]|nr:hypothetical protein [Verrucomicrobiae bacterium]
MNRPTRTVNRLLAGSLLMLPFTTALAGEDCDASATRLRAAIDEQPADLLQHFAEALTKSESCACELVKEVIESSNSDQAMVGDIVFTAVSIAPRMATTITECAVAAAPRSTSEIKAALKSALTDKGTYAYGKDAYEKNPAPVADEPSLDTRGIYLADPSASNPFPQDDDEDYTFGVSPEDMRGIYLLAPSGGGSSRAALEAERERRGVIERVTTIVRTIRRVTGGPGNSPGSGSEVTPSDPVVVVERRTVTETQSAPSEEPVIAGASSLGSENVLRFPAPAKSQPTAGGGSSIVRAVTLTPAQMELARARAQKEFDRLVEEELKTMEAESGKSVVAPVKRPVVDAAAEAKRQAVREEVERKVSEVRQQADTQRSRTSAPKAQSRIDAEEGRSIFRLEQEATKAEEAFEPEVVETPRAIAIRRVKEKYGTSIAVPIASADSKNLVAFASVGATGVVSVARTAYELDIAPALNAEPKGAVLAGTIEGQEMILALPPLL